MKKKLIIFLVVVISILLVIAVGANHWYSIKNYQQLPSFPVAALILFAVGLATILTHPLWILASVAISLIGYYFYENFIKIKKEISYEIKENKNIATYNQSAVKIIKIITLFATLFLIALISYFLYISWGDVSGKYEAFGYFSVILIPVYIIYFIYFIILALKYSREKSNMDILDKTMFYILLAIIGGFFTLTMSTLIK